MEPQRTTGRDIRRRNRSAVLLELFLHGPLSRLDLAGRTRMSPATASNVTSGLLDEGIVVEAGRVESDGGRPRVLLRVDPGYGHLVGVVLAETDLRVELFDLSMTRLAARVLPPPPGPLDPVATVTAIAAGVRGVTRDAGLAEDDVLGVGIASPGIVEQGPSPRVHAPAMHWDGVPVVQLLREAGLRAPVFVENGATTMGQAEMWFGAGQGVRDAVVVLIGYGVGACVITGGSTFQGFTSSGGEWGHTTVMFGGRECRCGSRGCLEAYIGAQGVLARYRRSTGAVLPGDGETARFHALLRAGAVPGPAADLLDETAELVGTGIADLINLFNPERVILGGWAGLALARHRLPRIRAAVRQNALPHPFAQASIELCGLGEGAVALGAATLPAAALLAGTIAERAGGPAVGLPRTPVEVA